MQIHTALPCPYCEGAPVAEDHIDMDNRPYVVVACYHKRPGQYGCEGASDTLEGAIEEYNADVARVVWNNERGPDLDVPSFAEYYVLNWVKANEVK